ncbi:uncharacterized protein PGTG_02588 [Puccinia graminis f. sp. tritici CRL 75-36-700-3]|uniref:Uncharacterized protein n=1 Tax=Puccinia graminis f. sp. tritici (strain CRL 75-36-700-3 / race SCCL) TaxID=418459 RepID=E3JVS2_PUCGT|nr:uncharacterized protein PGTG_02588 [Puccinia graminis f. sp. tritici CRL 75-36-700-3]EFP76147.1 hypothetical protein PGTG_02588 [Puccinia graminis f. sp. tritici CRL 75-36-700-3]
MVVTNLSPNNKILKYLRPMAGWKGFLQRYMLASWKGFLPDGERYMLAGWKGFLPDGERYMLAGWKGFLPDGKGPIIPSALTVLTTPTMIPITTTTNNKEKTNAPYDHCDPPKP